MDVQGQHHASYWERAAPVAPALYPTLPGDLHCDVVVVGGGITGLTAALRLAEAGRSVVLLEMLRVGAGTTGHSTGHLDNSSERTLRELLRKFGADELRLVLAGRRDAIDHIEERDRTLRLEADVQRVPAYLVAEDARGADGLEQEYEAARQLDLDVALEPGAPLPFPVRRALVFYNQGRMSPLRYVQGLARALRDRGGLIFEQSRVENIEESTGGVRVATARGTVHARTAVVAAHAALLGLYTVESRAYPWQSYVVAARVRNPLPDALFWDTADPYHYTRRAASADPHLLLVGGADHRTGKLATDSDPLSEVERYAGDHFQVEGIEHRWSSEYYEPADGLPYVGRVPRHERIFEATGFSGEGLTFGTLAGLVMADLALGRGHVLADILRPARIKPLASAAEAGAAAVRVARHLVVDRVGSGDVRSPDEIAREAGAVLVVGGERVAAFRDEHGQLHTVSPVCTHMKCIVHWNHVERTWDCPCHGGRYDRFGHVIAGPPTSDLAPVHVGERIPG